MDPHSFLADPDPHPFFADPDTAVLLNADSDPAAFLMRIRILLNKMYNKLPYEECSGVEKDKQYCSKVKKKNLALIQIYLQFRQISFFLSISSVFNSNFFLDSDLQLKSGSASLDSSSISDPAGPF